MDDVVLAGYLHLTLIILFLNRNTQLWNLTETVVETWKTEKKCKVPYIAKITQRYQCKRLRACPVSPSKLQRRQKYLNSVENS